MKTSQRFADMYCQKHALDPDRYAAVVLRRALYPHARVVYWFIVRLQPEFGEADRDIVEGVGRLMRLRDFGDEAEDFAHHSGNCRFLRRRFRLRVSTRRLRRLFKDTLGYGAQERREVPEETATPWLPSGPGLPATEAPAPEEP